jgi:hypothetical protein
MLVSALRAYRLLLAAMFAKRSRRSSSPSAPRHQFLLDDFSSIATTESALTARHLVRRRLLVSHERSLGIAKLNRLLRCSRGKGCAKFSCRSKSLLEQLKTGARNGKNIGISMS